MIDENKLIMKFADMQLQLAPELSSKDKIAWDTLEGAIEAVKEQPKASGWIPCSEGLPGDGKYILLSFENFTMPTVGRYEADDEGGAFHVGDDDETCVQYNLFVNAWMPLPEPWKEGNR